MSDNTILLRFDNAYGGGDTVSTILDMITNAKTAGATVFLAGDGAFKNAILASPLTQGYAATAYNAGTKSSGTFTPVYSNGNVQYCVNGGSFTIAAPSGDGVINLMVTNNGSAGTITFSGFTVGSSPGDSLDTTNGHIFFISILSINSVATYIVKAAQ